MILPKISIVTPSYNQGAYIEETILSVINQDYPNVEYIIIDGGSNDETLEIIKKYEAQISYWKSEPDKGQSHAINKGFQQATGTIYTWLNSDDQLLPGALYAMAIAFHHSKADLISGVCEINKNGQDIGAHLTAIPEGVLNIKELLDIEQYWLKGRYFFQPENFFTRDLWERAGGYVREDLYYSMDYDLWVRFAAAKAKVGVIGQAIARYRIHAEQKTSSPEKYKPELKAVSQALAQQYLGKPIATPKESSPPIKQGKKVLFLNDLAWHGGAGIAHQRIATSFQLAGHEVFPIAFKDAPGLGGQLPSDTALLDRIAQYAPDLVVFGNIHHLPEASVEVLAQVSASYPSVFVMHDQWLLTGRCAYTGTCTKYETSCDASCPTANSYPPLAPNLIADFFLKKRAIVRDQSQLLIVGDSRWISTWAEQAISTKERRIPTIYYGLDFDVFYPRDSAESRELLGLPKDKFIIIAGSVNASLPRKGGSLLLEALRTIPKEDILLLSFGNNSNLAVADHIELYATGWISDPALMAQYYSAADLFVGPSLEEAFGQTFIEAAACGTPSIGFAIGGVPEAITEGITGSLVQEVSALALAQKISSLYDNPSMRAQLRRTAPAYIRNQFSYYKSYYTFKRALAGNEFFKDLVPMKNSFKLPSRPLSIPQTLIASNKKKNIFDGYSRLSSSLGFGEVFTNRFGALAQRLVASEGKLMVNSPKAISLQFVLQFRLLTPRQHLEIYHQKELLYTQEFSESNATTLHEISIPVRLTKGFNTFLFKVRDAVAQKKPHLVFSILFEQMSLIETISKAQLPTYKKEGLALMEAKDWTQAKNIWSLIATQYPEKEHYFRLIRCLMELGLYEEALDYNRKLFTKEQDNISVLQNMARIYMATQDWPQALTIWKTIHILNPSGEVAKKMIARCEAEVK